MFQLEFQKVFYIRACAIHFHSIQLKIMVLTVLLRDVIIFNGILHYTESDENFRNLILHIHFRVSETVLRPLGS